MMPYVGRMQSGPKKTQILGLCIEGHHAGSVEILVYATAKKVIRYLKRRYNCLHITQ
jgi:hypothetical protein